MFCSSCGKQLTGHETFCGSCGNRVQQVSQGKTITASAMPAASIMPTKPKTGLHGFAKGWMIFVIVAYSAVIASNLTYMTDPYRAGLLIMPMLCIAAIIVGAALLLKAKPYGFWIMSAFSIILMLLNGLTSNNYMLVTGGGLIYLFLTWLFTRKQINYGRKNTV